MAGGLNSWWSGLSPTSKRNLAVGGIGVVLISAIVGLASLSPEVAKPASKQSTIKHILTDSDPRSLGIDGISAPLSITVHYANAPYSLESILAIVRDARMIILMRTVIETPTFQKQADALWTEDERLGFITWISSNPLAGDLIPPARMAHGKCDGLPSPKANVAESGWFISIYPSKALFIWLRFMKNRNAKI